MIPAVMHFYGLARSEVLDMTFGQFISMHNHVHEIASHLYTGAMFPVSK